MNPRYFFGSNRKAEGSGVSGGSSRVGTEVGLRWHLITETNRSMFRWYRNAFFWCAPNLAVCCAPVSIMRTLRPAATSLLAKVAPMGPESMISVSTSIFVRVMEEMVHRAWRKREQSHADAT